MKWLSIERRKLAWLIGLVLLAPWARAQEEEPAPDSEYPQPQLVLALTAGGKTVQAKPGETARLGEGKNALNVGVEALRHFDYEGVAFDYPGGFAYQYEEKEHQCWTLEDGAPSSSAISGNV